MASINEEDIKKFRAKIYIEPIDDLGDLNPKSKDVIDIVERLNALEKKGFDVLNTVPDNNATCSIQVKYFITSTIERAKRICNYCIEKHVNKDLEGRLELNVRRSEFNSLFVDKIVIYWNFFLSF